MERWKLYKEKLESTSLFRKLDRKFREKEWFGPTLDTLERMTGTSRVYLVIGVFTTLMLNLILGYGGQLICNVIGFVYPAYQTIHAIESHDRTADIKWLTYWVVFSALNVVEFFSYFILRFFQFYWLAKCIFLIWCFAPIESNGSFVIYFHFIRPLFLKNKERIETAIHKVVDTAASYARSVQAAPFMPPESGQLHAAMQQNQQ